MPAMTPSKVKNSMRKSLLEMIDPSPSKQEVGRVWAFFDSKCAYCGVELSRVRREGHIDHLVPLSVNGVNHVSNRVLACGTCNGDEKRDVHWAEFIVQKCSANQTVLNERVAKIRGWQQLNKGQPLKPSVRREIEKICDQMFMQYDTAIKSAKSLRTSDAKIR